MELTVYTNIRGAFLFQLSVALVCLLGILLAGPKLIVVLAFIGLRPLILKQRVAKNPETYWRFYYRIGKFAVAFTAATLLLICACIQFLQSYIPDMVKDPRVLVTSILPYFLAVHAIIGIVYTDDTKAA